MICHQYSSAGLASCISVSTLSVSFAPAWDCPCLARTASACICMTVAFSEWCSRYDSDWIFDQGQPKASYVAWTEASKNSDADCASSQHWIGGSKALIDHWDGAGTRMPWMVRLTYRGWRIYSSMDFGSWNWDHSLIADPRVSAGRGASQRILLLHHLVDYQSTTYGANFSHHCQHFLGR